VQIFPREDDLAVGKRTDAEHRRRVRLSGDGERAWQAFLHAHHDVMSRLEAELVTEHALSMGDYDILVRLSRGPDSPLRMTDLADRVMVSPSGLTRMVNRLVDRGLVERSRSAQDARVVLVHVTDDGRRLVRRAARTHLRGIREHFTDRLTEAQLRALADVLETITGPHRPH
jgi:DNA-binding MarR family transcriptional regulator